MSYIILHLPRLFAMTYDEVEASHGPAVYEHALNPGLLARLPKGGLEAIYRSPVPRLVFFTPEKTVAGAIIIPTAAKAAGKYRRLLAAFGLDNVPPPDDATPSDLYWRNVAGYELHLLLEQHVMRKSPSTQQPAQQQRIASLTVWKW